MSKSNFKSKLARDMNNFRLCIHLLVLPDSASFPQGELLSPCRCSGSVRCTHQPCLIKWISERGSWACELCYYKYQVIAISTKNPLQVSHLCAVRTLLHREYSLLTQNSCHELAGGGIVVDSCRLLLCILGLHIKMYLEHST